MSTREPEAGAVPDLPQIDRLVHEPSRFLILAHLYVLEEADFLFLMRRTGLTRGNLSSHMSKLEAAGYVEIRKEFVGKLPHTSYKLTAKGRKAFQAYRRDMARMLDGLPK
jgi:DNA-binding MarR family transcriptional regulator